MISGDTLMGTSLMTFCTLKPSEPLLGVFLKYVHCSQSEASPGNKALLSAAASCVSACQSGFKEIKKNVPLHQTFLCSRYSKPKYKNILVCKVCS